MEDTELPQTPSRSILISQTSKEDLVYRLYSFAGEDTIIYSIEIGSKDESVLFEDISRNPDKAFSMYRSLANGEVSPKAAAEILEDLIESAYF